MPKKTAVKNIADLTFEEAFKELEETVVQLEDGELSLEAALALFERGRQLSGHCSRLLEQAELKVTQLTQDA
ncbi:MAG TPA: exodeoxyribonuclease VII small subunit [Anaerolineae bacterium]|nr:exodeoxyribonuclease VII small subunit [Anaerolineae bacterium]